MRTACSSRSLAGIVTLRGDLVRGCVVPRHHRQCLLGSTQSEKVILEDQRTRRLFLQQNSIAQVQKLVRSSGRSSSPLALASAVSQQTQCAICGVESSKSHTSWHWLGSPGRCARCNPRILQPWFRCTYQSCSLLSAAMPRQ